MPSTLSLDDYLNPHPNGIGLTFNYIVWQMLKLGPPCYVNIRKPSNPYRCERGPNPWEYYFEQDPAPNAIPGNQDDGLALAGNMAWDLRHQRAIQAFASQYIRLRKEIADEVSDFKAKYFKGRVLGVHLRGTDKATEYRPLSNLEASTLLEPIIDELKPDTIFLQTDDIDYWNYMQSYGVVSLSIPRSSRSIHHHAPQGPYEAGRCAVVDGFLGAECDYYARTPSNFSTISLIMGRHKSIHLLNKYCKIEPFPAVLDRALGL